MKQNDEAVLEFWRRIVAYKIPLIWWMKGHLVLKTSPAVEFHLTL